MEIGVVGELEPVDCGYNRDAALFEADFEGVALLSLNVYVVKIGGDFHRDNLVAGIRFDPDTDDRSRVAGAEETLVDCSFDDVFVIPEAVSVVEEVLDNKWVHIGK